MGLAIEGSETKTMDRVHGFRTSIAVVGLVPWALVPRRRPGSRSKDLISRTMVLGASRESRRSVPRTCMQRNGQAHIPFHHIVIFTRR